MPVSINMPTRAPEQQKEDPLDKIAKGLDIASKLYGFKVSYDTLQVAKDKMKAEVYGEHGQQAGDQILGAVSGKAPEQAPAPVIDPNAPPPIGAQPQSGPPIGGQPTPAFRGKREVQADQNKQEYATKLRTERGSSGMTKETAQIASAYSRLNKADPTPAGNIALIYSYMKMLDPGSTVREGEFATAENTTGAAGKITNLYNQMMQGYSLDPKQRAQFKNQARSLYEGQLQKQSQFDKTYQGLAQKSQIPWEDVGVDYGLTQEEQSPVVKSLKGAGQAPTKVVDGVTYRKVPGGWEAQ